MLKNKASACANAMKILHTSDWHLGHTLYNYDRTEEHTALLRQIITIVSQQKPDVFLLAGDVYHTAQPSAAVQTLFTNALVQIHDANPDMTIIITAGNHDSGSKHEIFRTPWRALKVHTVGTLDREHPEDHIIHIKDKGFVIALPYTHERNMPEGLIKSLLDEVERRNTEQLPVIMTAHTTVKGCDFTGHDHATEYMVGGIDAFDVQEFGTGYDYLALGHIHHEQFVHSGNHNVRYSGSPMAVSFDENYPHSVSMVEIKRHGERLDLEKIEIENPHPLVSLPTEGFATWEDAKRLLKDFPADLPAYVRLNVETESFLPPDANADVQALTESKMCRFCYINARRKTADAQLSRGMTVQEFQAQPPQEIARRYAEDMGISFDTDLQRLFEEAMNSL